MMMARRLRGEEKGTGICWIGRGHRQEMIHHLLARARGHRGIIESPLIRYFVGEREPFLLGRSENVRSVVIFSPVEQEPCWCGAICSIHFTAASILPSLLSSECVRSHSSRDSTEPRRLPPILRSRASPSATTQGNSDRPSPAITASSRASASLRRTAAIL